MLKMSMGEPIKTYEMPKITNQRAFQIYEVQGKTIRNSTYPHETDRPHRHKYYEICVFITGAGRHEIDFESHPIHSNSVHFLSPGQIHLISRENDYHGYLMVFSRDFYGLEAGQEDILFALPFFNNPTLVPILNLSRDDFDELLHLIRSIRKEYLHWDGFTSEILRHFLQIFLIKCKQYYLRYFADKNKTLDPHFALVQQFNALVEQQFRQVHQVQDYAAMMAMSPSVLNKHVKNITGFTAGEVILDRLMLQAKRYLIYTDLSNKEIAYQLNYQDPSYFSRIFKRKTGKSPSDFRKSENEKYQL
ncbi:helix-turn-helix domain-containing protein [Cyclobacterium salsum]|uniref:helix-turn-helix domain-containing protein n=1 Tax=Cyclobacterium salsum TaxID=2666329 RepID=UPI001F2E1B9E|nr:AraC family transcriptional regulator [Cyclobacterium salsum]